MTHNQFPFLLCQNDLNLVQFEGLEEALQTISLIYGPSRDTSYFLVDRVIRNSKLVSLHTQNLVLYDFFYSGLEELANETLEYVRVAEKTLPRYYDMVQNVSSTMAAFGFSTDLFTFPPERLAKTDNVCVSDFERFYESINEVEQDLEQLVMGLRVVQESAEDRAGISKTQLNLRGLYVNIDQLSTIFHRVKENCLEQFQNAVQDVVTLNKTYLEEAKIHVDLDYTFEFDEQAQDVYKDESKLKDAIQTYLVLATITKQELQENLTEELLNDMIARERDLIVKIQFRLTERLRRRVDKARADVYDWYELLVRNADAIQEYMPYRFSEKRTIALNIWKSPIAVVDLGSSYGQGSQAFRYTYKVNTSNWRRRDFHREKSFSTIKKIIDEYFDPINTAIDEFDDELGKIEQTLTTAIKQLRNLFNSLRSEEKLTTAFVL